MDQRKLRMSISNHLRIKTRKTKHFKDTNFAPHQGLPYSDTHLHNSGAKRVRLEFEFNLIDRLKNSRQEREVDCLHVLQTPENTFDTA